MTALPPDFVERMRRLLGPEADALFEALARPPLTGLRVNTNKLSVEDFRRLSPWRLEPLPWCPAGFLVEDGAQPGKHPYHAAGLYYLQEPSAMAVAEALAPRSGERVLDLAAAPGGKATRLVELTSDGGLVVANEVNRGRTKALLENLERWGARRAIITNEAVRRLVKAWGPAFDRVLLDAPCSGEGMFRKSEDAMRMWSEGNVLGCATRQDGLLAEAAALVRPGGVLTYSTCTFSPEENEQVVARFLTEHPDFTLEPVALEGASPGRPEWVPADLRRPDLVMTHRFWPHLTAGEGHFIAVMRRQDGPAAPAEQASFKPVSARIHDQWRAFARETLGTDPVAGASLTVFGDKLYAVPENASNLGGLRALRAGVWLATLKKDRLEPSHGLALALTQGAAHGTKRLDLSPDDPRLLRYLQGDILEEPGEAGWLLVTVSGFPLGWGKRSQNVVKNRYPKGLRVPAGVHMR